MADIYSLLDACQSTPHEAGEQAQARVALWDNWLVPVSMDNPVGDDPGYDDDFQQMREEVTGDPLPRAGQPWTRHGGPRLVSPGVCPRHAGAISAPARGLAERTFAEGGRR